MNINSKQEWNIKLKVPFSSEGRILSLHYGRVYKFDYSNTHSAEKAISRRQVSQYSNFSPFIRLWIIFFNSATEVYPAVETITFFCSILKSKPLGYFNHYKFCYFLPSDCIQFPISDNERMLIPCIIHISDLRNLTANLSWGVETQTGFEYHRINRTTKYIIIHYLSYKINDLCPPVM